MTLTDIFFNVVFFICRALASSYMVQYTALNHSVLYYAHNIIKDNKAKFILSAVFSLTYHARPRKFRNHRMAMTKFKVESGVQLLARLIKKPVIKNFYSNLFQPGLKNDDVVEIFGNNSSALLIDLISEALLPSRPNAQPLGVLVFNTVGQLNYIELINALKRKIISVNTNIDCDAEINTILHRTLNNLFILDVYDATQFYTTIHNLDNILAHYQNISLLIFDTLTAFYWSEQGFKITKMDLYMKNLLRMIQKVSKEYKVILIYSRPGYFSSSKDSGNIGEIQITEGVNFKVRLIDNNSTGAYEVNVRTIDLYYKKYMSIIDNEINWQ